MIAPLENFGVITAAFDVGNRDITGLAPPHGEFLAIKNKLGARGSAL
jgi:hypothetical protein